jgi:HK97 family phage major capsid protein
MDIETLLKGHVDSVEETLKGFEGKIATQADIIRQLELKAARPGGAGGFVPLEGQEPLDGVRGKKGMRFSNEDRAALIDYATKGTVISGAVDAEGGFLVPMQIANEIERLIELQSPVRQVARVVQMPGRDIRFPVGNAAMASGWISEKGNRVITASTDFFGVVPPGGELYAAPQLTLASLEDAMADLEGFIQLAVGDEFARNESDAFVNGDGVDKPRGFLAGTAPVATNDAGRAVGTLQYIPTGNASTLGADPVGTLIATVMAMKAGYRGAPGCAWMMSTLALSAISNLKDTNGRPIFLPSMREGIPGLLLGFPVYEAEQMPAVAANNFPIAFGNWLRGYVVGDRTMLSLIRDPYTTRGFMTLYFRKRVHGAVLNSETIKLVRVSVA